MKKLTTIVFIILFVAMTGACDTQNGCNEGSPKVFQLTAEQNGFLIRIHQFDQIQIELASNPSTGYTWVHETSSGSVVEQDGEPVFEQAPDCSSGMDGCGGTETFSFTAVGIGTQKIALIYKRSWEDDEEPIERFEVTVAAR